MPIINRNVVYLIRTNCVGILLHNKEIVLLKYMI